jgi:hypothetical protein
MTKERNMVERGYVDQRLTEFRPGDRIALWGWECEVLDVYIIDTASGPQYEVIYRRADGREDCHVERLSDAKYLLLKSVLLHPELPTVRVDR